MAHQDIDPLMNHRLTDPLTNPLTDNTRMTRLTGTCRFYLFCVNFLNLLCLCNCDCVID